MDLVNFMDKESMTRDQQLSMMVGYHQSNENSWKVLDGTIIDIPNTKPVIYGTMTICNKCPCNTAKIKEIEFVSGKVVSENYCL